MINIATPPYNPFPVSGLVYDVDASTALTSGTVTVEDRTKGTSTTVSIASNGEYTADLANLSSGWDEADVIYLTCHKGNFKTAEARLIIATGQTFWDTDLYLRCGVSYANTCKVKALFFSTQGTAHTFSVMSRDSEDVMVLQVTVAANSAQNIDLGSGIRCNGGFRIIRAASGTNVNEQTTGQANALGDINNGSEIINTAVVFEPTS